MIKNPKSIGCTTSLAGGMTLEQWDIEDDQFYANEGKSIMTRNLWASIPNLLMGFAVWLMWSVTATRIQIAHDNDPTVYHFKDFAPEIMGVSDGFRGCPGWYEHSCCSTWLDAPQADFDAWQASAQGQAVLGDVTYANADLFMKSPHFKPMMYNTNETAGSPDGFTPFSTAAARPSAARSTPRGNSRTASCSSSCRRRPASRAASSACPTVHDPHRRRPQHGVLHVDPPLDPARGRRSRSRNATSPTCS